MTGPRSANWARPYLVYLAVDPSQPPTSVCLAYLAHLGPPRRILHGDVTPAGAHLTGPNVPMIIVGIPVLFRAGCYCPVFFDAFSAGAFVCASLPKHVPPPMGTFAPTGEASCT